MFSSGSFRKPIVLTLLAAFLCLQALPVSAQETAPNPLKFVPADSFVCARINNFDATMALLDKYTEGIAPMPVGLGTMARMPLAQLVGDPMLKNIHFNGDFVVFAVLCGSGADNPHKNVLVAVLLPVTEYETFLREHPAASAPDENGISKLAPDQPNVNTIVRKFDSYALFTHASNYDKVVALTKALTVDKVPTLADTLNRREVRASARTPIWARANVQQVGEVFGPAIFEGLEKAKVELDKMNAQNNGIAAGSVMEIYVQFFKQVFHEVDSVTWAIRPAADVCRITNVVTPVEGRELQQILGSSAPPKGPNPLLPYFRNGAIMNVGMKNDEPLLKRFYDDMFSILQSISGSEIKQEDIDKLRKLTNESFDALGDALVFSWVDAPKATPPFTMKYIAQVEDPEAFNRIVAQEIELINEGAINNLYKGLGLDMQFTAKKGIATYKGVTIDGATLSFKQTGANAEVDKAIRTMYGEGLEYRWALVDRLMVYAVSADVDKDIRALIDEVKAPRPEALSTEMSQALSLLSNPANAHAVGTFNLARFLQMAVAMGTRMDGQAHPMAIDVPTESNVAFAVRVRNARITADCAVPKKQLMELKAAIDQIQKQAMEIQQKQTEAAPQTAPAEKP